MSNIDVDNWMHASDDERTSVIQGWDIDNGQGEDIVNRVATLFKGECVYKVLETRALAVNDRWVIEAFSETDDFEILTKRENIEFLGFHIKFKHINDY